VRQFAITPDSGGVVLIAPLEDKLIDELFVVPITGGPATRLSGDLLNGGNVVDFAISPDSQRVIYRADQETNDQYELFATFDDSLLVTPTPTATATATATPPAISTSRGFLPVVLKP
jgi:hypothetical protein